MAPFLAPYPMVDLCHSLVLIGLYSTLIILILRHHVYDFALQMAFIYIVYFETYNHPVK